MKNISIKNIIKHGTKKPEGIGPAAYPTRFARDWKIIVSLFALGLISLSLFAWQIYLSDQLAGGYLPPTEEPADVSVKTVNIKRLEADLQALQTKQADYLKLKANRIKLIDPSL